MAKLQQKVKPSSMPFFSLTDPSWDRGYNHANDLYHSAWSSQQLYLFLSLTQVKAAKGKLAVAAAKSKVKGGRPVKKKGIFEVKGNDARLKLIKKQGRCSLLS